MPSTFISFIHQRYYSNQAPVAEVNFFTIKLDTDQQARAIVRVNCRLRVFMLPALNTVRKLHFYKLAFPF